MTPAESALESIFMNSINYTEERPAHAQPWHIQRINLAAEFLHPESASRIAGYIDRFGSEHSHLIPAVRKRAGISGK